MFGYQYITTLNQPGYYLTVRNQWEYPQWFADILKIQKETFIEMLESFNAKAYKYGIYYFENEDDARNMVDNINMLAKLSGIEMKGISYNVSAEKTINHWRISCPRGELSPKYMSNYLKMPLEDYKEIMLSCNAIYGDTSGTCGDPSCCFDREEDAKIAVVKLRQYLKTKAA